MPILMYFPVVLRCDGCDATEELSWCFEPSAQKSFDKKWFRQVDSCLKEEAAALGWQISSYACHCPECLKKAQEEGRVIPVGGTDAKAVLGDFAAIMRQSRKKKNNED